MYDCDAMAAFLRDAYLTRGYYSQMLFPKTSPEVAWREIPTLW